VDTVCDEDPFPSLRIEAGLPDVHRYEASFRRRGIDLELRGLVNASGEIDDAQKVYKTGSQVFIFGRDQDEVDRTYQKMVERAKRRGEEPPRFERAEFSGSESSLSKASGELAGMKRKLSRFAAKVAIEFIERVTDRVFDPLLDPLRQFALQGAANGVEEQIHIVSLGSGWYWLPKTKRTLVLAEKPLDVEVEVGKQPPGTSSVVRLVHRLNLDGWNHVFELTLFSLIRVQLRLPEGLDLPNLSEDIPLN